jgi:hypothetical protein
MLENAHDTKKMKTRVPSGSCTGIPINIIPRNNTRMPFTIPLTVPPMIYANDISRPDRGAVNRSGNCCKSFICNIDDEVLAVALVNVFIMINPGRMNNV